MKKGIITAGVLAIAACTAATAYCWTTGKESIDVVRATQRQLPYIQ